MAIVSNDLLGFASGSVGGVTFQNWKLLHVIRSKPSVQYNPKTPAQMLYRVRFEACRRFYRDNEIVLKPLFQRLDKRRNPFNAFAHQNINLWQPGASLMNASDGPKMRFGKVDVGDVQECRLDASASIPWTHTVFCPYYYVGVGVKMYWGRIVYNCTTGKSICKLDFLYVGRDFWETDLQASPSDILISWFVIFSESYQYVSRSYYSVGQFHT